MGSACSGICSTWQPVAVILYNTGGDSMSPDSYIVPGGVRVAVVPATTPDSSINFNTVASTTSGGAWSAELTVPSLVAGSQYKAAAQTCYGRGETPSCVVTTQLFTA